MEMNNLRVESHVAQKNRRHKLRFQQNSGDPNHQYPPQPQDHYPYNPNVFPSEMINSVARNPQLLLPSGHGFVSHDQDQDHDSCSGPGPGPYAILPYPQDSNSWKTVVSSQQEAASDHFNVASYSNPGYSYVPNVPAFGSSPFYQNTLQQDHVTLQHPQGLSLSLSSSVPQLKDDDQPISQSGQKAIKSDLLPTSDPKSFMGVSAFAHRNTGPLGPFTGYATILKNSKYIKPAQELLNHSCDVGFQELVQTCHDVYSHKILEEELSWASDCSVASSEEHVATHSSSGNESLRPDFHRKKARLLYMQEEVCRKYKQYLQQMQMVISSFETVAGLSASTPYVCLALKAVSRHFHYIKNVISEQLSQMRKMVGEGLCSPTTTSNAPTTSRLKSGGGGGGAASFFASQQPVWRPQRGLPERAIAVLKTWLFDHFLHPYPSDADKHMLATQTGLTRNQVSNWFINARVRIWKPMVEEIHTLETKGLADPNSTNPQPDIQNPNRMDMSSLSNIQPPECSRNPGANLTVDEPNDHEKQTRPEYQIPFSGMDHRLMTIMPYPRSTFDASGLGPVSLTLGLRQNGEQLQQHFGGQLIHDFVG